MLLTKEQARAVYDAMCALNNVNGLLKVTFGDVVTEAVNVYEETDTGKIAVVQVQQFKVRMYERHESQALFHLAYDL